jgi:hypothetical protein
MTNLPWFEMERTTAGSPGRRCGRRSVRPQRRARLNHGAWWRPGTPRVWQSMRRAWLRGGLPVRSQAQGEEPRQRSSAFSYQTARDARRFVKHRQSSVLHAGQLRNKIHCLILSVGSIGALCAPPRHRWVSRRGPAVMARISCPLSRRTRAIRFGSGAASGKSPFAISVCRGGSSPPERGSRSRWSAGPQVRGGQLALPTVFEIELDLLAFDDLPQL